MTKVGTAMKCNLSQFEAIKPKLIEGGMEITELTSFESCPYLINNLHGEFGEVSNLNPCDIRTSDYNRTRYEEWDEKLFFK